MGQQSTSNDTDNTDRSLIHLDMSNWPTNPPNCSHSAGQQLAPPRYLWVRIILRWLGTRSLPHLCPQNSRKNIKSSFLSARINQNTSLFNVADNSLVFTNDVNLHDLAEQMLFSQTLGGSTLLQSLSRMTGAIPFKIMFFLPWNFAN